MAQQKPALKNFPLRLDPATMEAVERWAADEFRSVNGQLQWIIADALRRYHRQSTASRKDTSDRDSATTEE